ncbi:hypothetical protein NMS_0167 [Nonlabens marinus S1-08]|uniref:Uncharacterized protein n=1 Tax=Nonlabens marinus S1-08 TaxID=1454201 RepID=W8VZ93_9FLAO|nr:hypothetical protein NMS_0167 [Nonlabens marinus S1-08]
MRNLFIYYFLILLPPVLLFWFKDSAGISSTVWIASISGYALVYRTYVDGKRLAAKNIIREKDIWKMILPGRRWLHFRELYLKP